MNDEEINKPQNNYKIGNNLDALSVDELKDYIDILKSEIDRVKHIKVDKIKALETAKDYFKR
jgi:uncharacterized small protein (DUF1192 family)